MGNDMTNSNHIDREQIDIRESLVGPMSDEEAIAIMSGAIPASDPPEVDVAARQIFHGLLAETAVPAPVRQPWMKMAAALMVGVLVTTLVNTRIQVADSGLDGVPSIASANVTYLEVTRSANAATLNVISITDEPWVTLLADFDFPDAQRLHIYVERAVESGGEWEIILEQAAGVPTQGLLAVRLESDLLASGVHRLRIESEAAGQPLATIIVSFRVESSMIPNS